MADQNRTADDAEEPEDAEEDENEYEVERLVTREQGAIILRRLADGVANGSVELGDEKVVVAVPDQFELEVEYEQEDEEAELEVELEWPVVDGEAVAAQRGSEAHESDETEETEADEDDTDDVGEGEEPAEGGEPVAETDADGAVDEVVGIGGASSSARFELYRDRADEWRWRLVHDNGNIIADSGEGYDRKATARNGLESVMRNAPGATIITLDE